MTVKIRRALKATLAVAACAALIFATVGMTACSTKEVPGSATKSIATAPKSGVKPEDCGGTLNAVAYINYTLRMQESWHSVKQTYATAIGTTVTTTTYKDYRDGILVAEELVYGTGFGSNSTESHQFMFITEPEEDRSVYVRTGSKPSSAEDGPDDIEWKTDDAELWSENYYNTKYGLFMDEISLYVLNEETLLYTYDDNGKVASNGCGDVIDNGDGTYSQTFVLDTVMSTYYYSYSMMTHGGVGVPTFTSVDVTFTFNSNWEVLSVLENDVSSGITGSTCATTTYFSYDENDFDETTYAAGLAFFDSLEGQLEMTDIEEEDED